MRRSLNVKARIAEMQVRVLLGALVPKGRNVSRRPRSLWGQESNAMSEAYKYEGTRYGFVCQHCHKITWHRVTSMGCLLCEECYGKEDENEADVLSVQAASTGPSKDDGTEGDAGSGVQEAPRDK